MKNPAIPMYMYMNTPECVNDGKMGRVGRYYMHKG